MARIFKGYASAYSAAQTQQVKARRQQTRTLAVDFNGAMDPARTIESVTWECTSPWVTFLSDPTIAADQKSTSVTVVFSYSGYGDVKATVTLDDETQQNYEFACTVVDAPMYPSATYSSATGPYSVTASAP